MSRWLWAIIAVSVPSTVAFADDYRVDPAVGNSTFTAIFDASLGERITANSAQVACDLQLDETTNTASGVCSVPLTSIRVDNEDTKTEHFGQWATNKKTEPKSCRFEAKFSGVKMSHALVPEKPTPFAADVPFTICGRSRTDGGKEKVTGTAVLFPAGTYGSAKILRIRAKVEAFNRDRYQIGPKYTSGWFARVQSLAKIVAEEGTIELTLFAKALPAGGGK